MKKVRFESPVKTFKINKMNDSECHSPRPFIQKQVQTAPSLNDLEYRIIPFTNDPVQRFDSANSLPYPIVNKTSCTPKLKNSSCLPSNELDLSILDCSYESRNLHQRQNILQCKEIEPINANFNVTPSLENKSRILASMENKNLSNPPNVLNKKDDFFLRKETFNDFKNIHSQLNTLQLEKENNPISKKTEIMKLGIPNTEENHKENIETVNSTNGINQSCKCHHCIHSFDTHNIKHVMNEVVRQQFIPDNNKICPCSSTHNKGYTVCPCYYRQVNHIIPTCNCDKTPALMPQNAINKKKWTIEKYEKNNKSICLDIETQDNVLLEKKEPTVADLFKIIKLQNEQLQLLQEKVDKFISVKTYEPQNITKPIQKYIEEHVEVKSIGTEEKISIGVMTSFEMVRTSTIINKEIVKKNEAQIQCNRSQISIKEVVSKTPPVNLNFLDGLTPVLNETEQQVNRTTDSEVGDFTKNTDFGLVDKTLNEMSLYNIQVDNAITPMMSPEQSLYLDVRDYSDSDSSDDQSNVGWTYYNKVMTHVNGMLQESDMPSSASALYRKGKQKCMQMQIDKTNVSVAKRVTFGDDPLGFHEQPHLPAPATDTSLKMNQLAAKYLKNAASMSQTPSPKPVTVPVDMSLATRNYMEKHKLLQGNNHHQINQRQMEIPKFLDITALKQQPKFL